MIAPGSAAAKVHAQALSAVRPGPAIRCRKMPAPPRLRAPRLRAPHGGWAPFRASVGRPPAAKRRGSRPRRGRALRSVGGVAGGRAAPACRARGPCPARRAPGSAPLHDLQPAPASAARAAPARDGCIPRRGRYRRAPRREADGPRAGRAPAPSAAPPHRVACEGAARPRAEREAP